MFTKTVLPRKHWVSVQMAEPILSLCCMQTVCLVTSFSAFSHSSTFHIWDVGFLYLIHSMTWMFSYGRLVLPFVYFYELVPGSLTRRQTPLEGRRQTSSLCLFIFIFSTSLKVQRVSWSIVKYLYIHICIYFGWFDSTDVLVKIVHQSLKCSYAFNFLSGTRLIAIYLFILMIMY